MLHFVNSFCNIKLLQFNVQLKIKCIILLRSIPNQRWVWRGATKCVTVRYLGSVGGGRQHNETWYYIINVYSHNCNIVSQNREIPNFARLAVYVSGVQSTCTTNYFYLFKYLQALYYSSFIC